jgi:hypothetical protein
MFGHLRQFVGQRVEYSIILSDNRFGVGLVEDAAFSINLTSTERSHSPDLVVVHSLLAGADSILDAIRRE